MLEHESPDTPADIGAILDRARALVSPEEGGTPYAQRYHQALQEHPDAVLAHRDVTQLLRKDSDSALPSQRPH
jgi:hypothetical protein